MSNEYLIKKETLDGIASQSMKLAGKTEAVSPSIIISDLTAANTEVSSQTDLIAQITTALEGKAAGGGEAEPALQEKTVSPTTSKQTVTPDTGYDGLSEVTVNAMPTATQATPSITVSSSGLITASATQTAGYVSAGTESATKQLTTQAAQTIVPSTSDKTITSGRYLIGTQTIKGDANLVASNIVSGVSIFGVSGSYKGSGSEGTNIETTTASIPNVTSSTTAIFTSYNGSSFITETATPIQITGSIYRLSISKVVVGSIIIVTAANVTSPFLTVIANGSNYTVFSVNASSDSGGTENPSNPSSPE